MENDEKEVILMCLEKTVDHTAQFYRGRRMPLHMQLFLKRVMQIALELRGRSEEIKTPPPDMPLDDGGADE